MRVIKSQSQSGSESCGSKLDELQCGRKISGSSYFLTKKAGSSMFHWRMLPYKAREGDLLITLVARACGDGLVRTRVALMAGKANAGRFPWPQA